MENRNLILGLLAHVDAGKTTLSEALLFETGAIRSLGRVDHRDTLLDHDSQERARGITIFSKTASFTSSGRTFTLLDTPGHVDFSSEMERTLSVLDYAVLIVSAADGVQGHTETIWRLLSRHRIPTLLFVNKTDQPGTDRARLLSELQSRLSPLVMDIFEGDKEELALLSEELLSGYLETGSLNRDLFPSLIRDRKCFPVIFGSALRRTGIRELLDALTTLTVCPQYPDEFGAVCYKITHDESGKRLSHMKITGGILKPRQVLPAVSEESEPEKTDQLRVYFGSRYENVSEAPAGTVVAVTGLKNTLPGQAIGSAAESFSPVLEPVLNYRLILPAGIDAAAFLPKLKELEEENPELSVTYEPLLKEIQVHLMGAVQTEILKEQLKSRFGAEVSFSDGSIVYRETIRNTVEGVGHFEPLRHYAEVHLLLSPLPPGSGLVFSSEASEDLLSKNWQRLVLTHLSERRHRGVLTGAPLTDVKITLVAGKAHPKHTEGGDFRQATYRAVRQGLMQAESVLLEPYYRFRLTVPAECVGHAMTDLDRLGASFTLAPGDDPSEQLLLGTGAVSKLSNYHTAVNSYTRGRGRLRLTLDGYRECPEPEPVILEKAYDPSADLRHTPDSVFCSHGSGFTVSWDEVPKYMHLPSWLLQNRSRLSLANADISLYSGQANDYLAGTGQLPETFDGSGSSAVSLTEQLDISLGTEDVDRILKNATHANMREQPVLPKKRKNQETKTVYKGTENKQNTGKPYLLVDGYNVIHAWPELCALAADNFDAARGRLLDILCNFQAMDGSELIAVFDAYRVLGHPTEYLDYKNIHVVFTKTAETADRYIEHFAHENGQKYRIRVVTSDGMEQIIIRGGSCLVTSSREFEAEVKAMEKRIREEYL